MSEKAFNWAFVGAGGIAHSVAKRITGSGRHKIVAVYNRTATRAEKFANKYGGTVCDSVEAAASASGVDGVYINVTNNAHYDCCMRALSAGKAVLVEKPFTTDAEQAEKLFETARQNNVYLCEAMWTWFSDQAVRVKSAIDRGEIGAITGGEISLCLPIAFGKNNRLKSSALAGGALLDLGVYPVTYAYRLFGKPRSVTCSAEFKFGVDMSDDIIFGYDGFDIRVKASVRSLCGSGERLVIKGERGRITAGAFHSGGAVKIISDGRVNKIPRDKNLMLTQFDRAADEIRSGKTRSEYVRAEHTVAVMEILDAIRGKIGLKYSFEK